MKGGTAISNSPDETTCLQDNTRRKGQEFKPRSRPLDSLPSRRGPPIELPQKQDGGRLPPGGLREFLLCPVASRRIREPSEPNYAELLMFLAQRRRGHDTPLQRSFSDPERPALCVDGLVQRTAATGTRSHRKNGDIWPRLGQGQSGSHGLRVVWRRPTRRRSMGRRPPHPPQRRRHRPHLEPPTRSPLM